MDKYISPQRIMILDDPKGGTMRTVEIGYDTDGLQICILNASGYHISVVPVDRAGLLIEAITLAAALYRAAKAEGKP